jgi:hypothetical protein
MPAMPAKRLVVALAAVVTLVAALLGYWGLRAARPATPQAGFELRGQPINPPAPLSPAPNSGQAEPSGAPIGIPRSSDPVSGPPAAPGPSGLQEEPATLTASGEEPDYREVGFDKLAGFEYRVPDPDSGAETPAPAGDQIPAAVKELNGRKVAVKGFMLPLRLEGGTARDLLLMRDQSLCCFGAVPKVNEWISVKMTGPGVKPVMDQVVTVEGRFQVGEFFENGVLVGIYRMEGATVTTALDL